MNLKPNVTLTPQSSAADLRAALCGVEGRFRGVGVGRSGLKASLGGEWGAPRGDPLIVGSAE